MKHVLKTHITLESVLRKITIYNIISLLLLSVGAIVVLAPILWMFTVAIQESNKVFSLPPNWLPKSLTIQNYKDASNVPIHIFALNSLIISLSITIGQLITGSLAGYAFAKLQFRGSNMIFSILLISLMVPILVTIIPIFRIMKMLNLLDTLLSVILPFITTIFSVFFMRQFFMTFPRDLIDAGRIEGASHWRIFWTIALPLARPSLAALGIITFTNSWNEYFIALVFLSSWEKMTLPVGMRALSGIYGSGNVGAQMAGMSIVVAFTLIVFLMAQRHIIKGLTSGSMKG